MVGFRFFRKSTDSGTVTFFRFSGAHGADSWTGGRWVTADDLIERLFTDPDFDEVGDGDLPTDAQAALA
jgi:hypothetical protein